MTAPKKTPDLSDLTTAYTSFFIDLPFANTRRLLGVSDEKEATEATWKSYDATVKFTSTAIEDLYRNPVVGELTATMMDSMLRWQKAGTTMTGAFFTGLWKTMGLPTAGEVQALREEVRALAERSQPVELQVKPKIKPTSDADLARQVKPKTKPTTAQHDVIPLHRNVA